MLGAVAPRHDGDRTAHLAAAMNAHWEHFDHGADIGVRGFGDSRAAAFEQAALALTAVVADPAGIRPRQAVAMHCEAGDDERLLVAWLNAVLYEMATRGILVRSPSSRGVAEEAPGACKDVGAVVDAAQAAGLVRKVAQLEPLVCVKG